MRLGLLAAAATGVQVGAAIVASRAVVQEVPPLTLAMLRYAIGFFCLLPFVLKPFWPVARTWRAWAAINFVAKDLLALAALGIGQFGVLIALLNAGLQHVSAAQAALIFSLFPLLTLLLAAALGRERVSAPLLAGVLLSIGGVAVSLLPRLTPAGSGHWWGEAAVLAAACVGALCSVLYRPYLLRYRVIPVSAFAMLASVLALAGLALAEDWPHRLMSISAPAWAAIGFIGVSSGAGYFCWLYALKHESPTRVTVFLALNPVTAAWLGWQFLDEALPATTLAALALIAAGLWMANRPARARGTKA